MKPSQAYQTLKLFVEIKQPAFVHGSPGCGKSAIIHQLADELEASLIDMRLSQMDSVDLRGIPYKNENGQTAWAPNSQLPHEKVHGKKGILFLDEMNSAAKSVMAAGYQLVLDRKIGDYKLPSGWTVIAAGNLISDRAIVEQMPTPLKNRFAHILYETDNEDWCAWAIKADITIEVLGFMRFRPALLNDFERALSKQDKKKARETTLHDQMAFATPRSWEFVDRVIKHGLPRDLQLDVLNGLVGEGPAAEFLAYMNHYRELPNLDNLLLNPKNAPVPKNPATLYALATGLAAKATPDNFDRVTEYLKRIPVEFQALCMKDAVQRNNDIFSTKAFNIWASENNKILL